MHGQSGGGARRFRSGRHRPGAHRHAQHGETARALSAVLPRIGFVHASRPLSADAVRSLLSSGWTPEGTAPAPFTEAVAAAMRFTGGNFLLLERLLSQTGRITRINDLSVLTVEAVTAARESLIIGQ